MYTGDDVAAVVVDVGSTMVKAGFAGEDTPKATYPTVSAPTAHIASKRLTSARASQWVGVIERDGDDADNGKAKASSGGANASAARSFFVGANSFAKYRDGLEMRTPVQNGLICDWDLVERLWDHGLRDRLRVDPSEHPLLHSEAPHTDGSSRQRLTELVFESLRTPAFYLAKDPVLSCFATGRDKGLVVDSGGDYSVASCVHDGFSLRKSVVVSALGGSSLTADLLAHLHALGAAVRPRFDVRRTEVKPGEFTVQLLNLPARDSYRRAMIFDVARDVKESLCRVSEQPWHDVQQQQQHAVAAASYELPDGHKIELAAHKFALAEPLFAPVAPGATPIAADTLEPQQLSIPQITVAALRRADVDVQRDLFANVVVTGGNSMLPGFSERLTHELRDACAPQMFKLKMIAAGFAAERRFSVWIGGSILASLGTFQQLWISKQEYDETGAQIVQTKCP